MDKEHGVPWWPGNGFKMRMNETDEFFHRTF